MRLRKLVRPLIAVVLVGAAAFAAFATHETWLPRVFPSREEKPAPTEKGPDDKPPGDRVTLSEQAQKNLGINAGTLTPREYWRTILIPGIVAEVPGESDRGVTARSAGVVTEIKAKPGDTVKAGATLFTLSLASEFLQHTQTELAKTATDLAFAITERDRVEKLVLGGTTPAAELKKHQTQVDRLTTQVKSYRRQLELFGLTEGDVKKAETGDAVTEVKIFAPPRADGTPADTLYEVKDLKVRPGDHVQAGSPLCTLADHRRLYVEGWAFKSEAKALAVAADKRAEVRAEFADENPGDWPPVEPLVIHHLSNQVDPVNRTFPFYLSLDNQAHVFTRDEKTYFSWRFRPGQRVRLRVPVEKLPPPRPDGKAEPDPFVLPAGAVVREGPEAFVFVQAGDVFVRRPVRVLYEDRTEVVIANDGSVTRAELVVRNQAAAINRALKLAAAADVIDHDH
jgi:membrane fusion protein, heavy metal efflux system